MEIIKDKTQRGFAIYNFDDFYGKKCSIQKSSLATDDAIWIGINEVKPQILASKVNRGESADWIYYPIHPDVLIGTRMHLTKDQVKELLPILQRFVETGEI